MRTHIQACVVWDRQAARRSWQAIQRCCSRSEPNSIDMHALEWGVRAGSMWPLLVKRHMPRPMIKDLMKAIQQVLFATKHSFNIQMFLMVRRSPSCGRSHRTSYPKRWAWRKVLVGKAQAKSTSTRKRSDFSSTISSTCACVEEQERVQHAPRCKCVQGSGFVFARSAICHLHLSLDLHRTHVRCGRRGANVVQLAFTP